MRTLQHRNGPSTRALIRLAKDPTQIARGGGASGDAGRHSSTSSWRQMRAQRENSNGDPTTGGGSEAAAANHWEAMPPQASIARSTTDRGRSGRVAGSSHSSGPRPLPTTGSRCRCRHRSRPSSRPALGYSMISGCCSRRPSRAPAARRRGAAGRRSQPVRSRGHGPRRGFQTACGSSNR